MFHRGLGTAPDYKMAHALYLTYAKTGYEAGASGIADLYESRLIHSKMPTVEGTAWRIAGILHISHYPDKEISEHLTALLTDQHRRLAGERAYALLTQVLEDRELKKVTVEQFIALYVDHTETIAPHAPCQIN